MAVNFESAFHLSQLANPILKASGTGSIINISFVSGLAASAGLSIYSVAKGTARGKGYLIS